MEILQKYRSKILINSLYPFINKDTRILDIGCGNGIVSHEIIKAFNCPLIGTDILDYQARPIKFRKMEKGDKLNFPDKSFDIGLFIDVLHHMPFKTQVKLLQESLRVCSQVILFEVKPTIVAKILDYATNKINNPSIPVLLTHRTDVGWSQLFGECNIRNKLYHVKKPFFAYPITNFLFTLANKDATTDANKFMAKMKYSF